MRDAEQLDRDLGSARSTSIASEALVPVETIMCTLGASKQWRRGEGRFSRGPQLYLNSLVTHQVHARPPMIPTAPVIPEERRIPALLDNHKVWFRYYKATQTFQRYKERTRILVEEALQPLSPLSRLVPRLDVLLNPKLEDDPPTRKIYEQLCNEMDAMLKVMNKRLRL